MKFTGLLLIFLSLLVACGGGVQTQLEKIQERGELHVLTHYGPISYYIKGEELAGFEYELAHAFANYLNVSLKIIVPDNLADILQLIEQGKADIAAAGLTITAARKDRFRFGPVYQQVTQQLVYRQGTKRPKNVTALEGGQLEVVANSSHVEQLRTHQHEVPELSWIENKELDNRSLLELVQLEMIDYTIADSNEFIANRTVFPELQVAFNISKSQSLAWAMPLTEDDSLYQAMQTFFEQMEMSGDLDRLIEKYYGHIRRFDYVDTRTFHRKIQTHLPHYQTLFEKAGEENEFDWRLLAAVSYQESHWDPKAVSYTGVRGLMMLTELTAKQMEIDDREDPVQSISAGAAYLAFIRKNLPEQIEQEEDKLWMTVASYNIGRGHLEDARILSQKAGKDPNHWINVREYLPLLSKKQWYQHTKHGYARGSEPVHYVENIRRYYDILVQVLSAKEKTIPTDIEELQHPKKPDLPIAL